MPVNDPPLPVILNEPLNMSNFSVFPEFNWNNATDVDDVNNLFLNYSLQIDDSPSFSEPVSYYNGSITETDNTTEDVQVSGLSDGTYYWRVLADDGFSNSSWSEVRYFTYDTQEPLITVSYPGNNSILYTIDDDTASKTLSINFTIDEQPASMENTIDSAWWVNSSGDSNSTDFVFIKDVDANTRSYALNITDWGPDGLINFSVWTNDSAGNEKALHYFSYTITSGGPTITWTSPATDVESNPILATDNFDILINITPETDPLGDPVGINYTWIEIDYPNGSKTNITMGNSSVTDFFFNFTADFPDGFYYMRTFSNYTFSGKEGTAGTVLMREIDNTLPNITTGNITVASAPGINLFNNSWSKYGDLEFNFAISDNWTQRDSYGGNTHEILNCSVIYFNELEAGQGEGVYNITKDSPVIDIGQSIAATGANVLTNGVYNWTINCTDELFYTVTDNRTKIINIDLSYPQFVSFDYPLEDELLSRNQSINLTITDIFSGVNHTWLEINNSAIIEVSNESLTKVLETDDYTYEWDTQLYEDGDYTLTIYTNDSADNVNLTIRNVKVDNSPPNITLESPPNNSVSGTVENTFQVRVWDFSTTVNCSLILNDQVNKTNAPIINNTLQSFFTELTTDNYNWTVNCTDEENNMGTNLSYRWRSVDVDNPLVTLNVPSNPLEFYVDNASINWSIIEPNIEVNYTDVTLPNGTSINRYYGNFSLFAQDNLTLLGIYPVSLYVNDSASHEVTSDRTLVVQDTIAPSVILVLPENGTVQNSSSISFSFNVSDYHSVSNCTLWLNQTESYINTTITNDIAVIQNINLTNITDEENVPWNLTCYDNSSNLNNTEEALYIDIDTTPPLIDFINPTTINNSYVSRNSTYVKVSIIEPHNDTFVLVWNYTSNYTSSIEDMIITPGGGNVIVYERNLTNLTDGIYEYYIFSNDTLANESVGHSNTSEIRTIVIDETSPLQFNLIDPSNNAELTDNSPALNWDDAVDINLDNYSVEFSADANFTSVNTTFNSAISYYAIQESNALSAGEWYWRVKAFDKANNERISTNSFKFTISDVAKPTTFIAGPGGGGGGGGGKKIVKGLISIIQPGTQTVYEGKTIITPLVIKNEGNKPLKKISLKALSNSPAIELELSKIYIDFLDIGQEEIIDLKIIAKNVVGTYEVTVEAEVKEPTISDQSKFYVNLLGFGMGKKTLLQEKLRFVGKLFESNPECLELNEIIEEAKKGLETKEYDKSLGLIETAVASCEELIQTKEEILEKPAEPKKTFYLLLAEMLFFMFMFLMIYRYYRRRSYRGPIIQKRKKTSSAFVILIVIFLGGFFMLKGYTGFTAFEINLDENPAITTGGDGNLVLNSLINGTKASDQFGVRVNMKNGDINGDGYADVIIGTHQADPLGVGGAGQAYVFFGSAGGISNMDVSQANITINGTTTTDNFGISLSSGDINNDSYDDIIVGAWKADTPLGGGNDDGQTYVFFGANYTEAINEDYVTLANITLNGSGSSAHFGEFVSNGDVNNDGYSDIIVGAFQADIPGYVDGGQVHVFFGANYTEIINQEGQTYANLTFNGSMTNHKLGDCLFSGDINNDNYADIIVGARQTSNAGQVLVFFGDNYTVINEDSLAYANLTFNGTTANDLFGVSVTSGDINNDNYDDVIVGAYQAIAPPDNDDDGQAHVFFGADYTEAINQEGQIYANITINGTANNDALGVSVASGDVNNDSYDDIIVGAYLVNLPHLNNNDEGQAYIFFGADYTTPINDNHVALANITMNGTGTDYLFGMGVGSGDINNDGYADVIVGASGADAPLSYNSEGQVSIYSFITYPLFEFVNPAENNTHITNNFTTLNITLIESNNDTFYISWNGTQYNLTDMNKTAEMPEGKHSYELNFTNLSEGEYIYYAWANNTKGLENKTANRTLTIDETNPTSFSLLNPSDGNRSTDNTPFLLWEDSNDTNFDNYIVEFSPSTSFNPISYTYSNTSSNYQIDSSESLPLNGTFYWRVTSYDKAGNYYTSSYFTYHVGFSSSTAFTPGTTGSGGGGGKRTERRQIGLELIKPSALSFFTNRQIIIPLEIENTGTEKLRGITLTVESDDLDVILPVSFFQILSPKQSVNPSLTINPVEDPGRYNLLIKASVDTPEFSDAIMFFMDIVEFGSGNKTEAQDRLTFVVDFIKQNEECAELEKFIIEAQESLRKGDYDQVLTLTDQAVQSCKDLVSTSKGKTLEKKKVPQWKVGLPIVLEIFLFLLILQGVYSYYKRLKFKRGKPW